MLCVVNPCRGVLLFSHRAMSWGAAGHVHSWCSYD
jgi:hypothetical protein